MKNFVSTPSFLQFSIFGKVAKMILYPDIPQDLPDKFPYYYNHHFQNKKGFRSFQTETRASRQLDMGDCIILGKEKKAILVKGES